MIADATANVLVAWYFCKRLFLPKVICDVLHSIHPLLDKVISISQELMLQHIGISFC